MRIKFVTAIYSNLYGTEFGGRPSRKNHYRMSLISLLKMTNADFVLYTSQDEYKELDNFFHEEKGINREKLKIKIFDLYKTKYFDLIRSKKNIECMKKIFRCYEVQYNKFYWLEN